MNSSFNQVGGFDPFFFLALLTALGVPVVMLFSQAFGTSSLWIWVSCAILETLPELPSHLLRHSVFSKRRTNILLGPSTHALSAGILSSCALPLHQWKLAHPVPYSLTISLTDVFS